ncbi:hypothetical protein [Ornithinibacillus contaminans]|uniref:hypothetical protein n=1 Tax=Ornithinibacillus contaminans TaxID=694055 RepID=UPI00064DC139|nr:hypothetical protein [Ornithinibacillus contaminans]
MKRSDFLGATLLICGVLLFGIIHLAIANYAPSMLGWGGNTLEKFQQARDETMVNVPYFLSIAFMVIGIVLLFFKEFKKIVAYMTKSN